MIVSEDTLKDIVLSTKLLDERGWEEVRIYAHNSNVSLYEALLEKDIITDEDLGSLIAHRLQVPFIVLSKVALSEEVFRLIPEKIARRKKAIPFARDLEGVKIALANPADLEFLALLSKKTNEKVTAYLATERDIFNTLHIYKSDLQKRFNILLPEAITSSSAEVMYESAPVAKIVDLLIDSAYQDKSSDIHIEPGEKNTEVRFRIDGIMHEVLVYPKGLHDRIVTRMKVMAKLRTDEHHAPQDGKITVKLDEEELDLRVSIVPVVDGEKIVLRVLSSHFRQFSLSDLGINETDLAKIEKAISKSFGMILSTGPTGSGKTTSIYAILKILNTREKNITTIEDPVEYRIKGVNQIQANPKTNLTFASGLRSILRQDPNIIFVGEIRDSETAGIAVNAALTGHLVLSTLHTNDAATSLPRLTDMKIEPFLVASTVNVIIAQRLVRKICEMCKSQISITADEMLKNIPEAIIRKNFGPLMDLKVYRGIGCRICHNTGYSGRVGVYEVLEVSKDIRKLIIQKKDSDLIMEAAISEGMMTMLDDGLRKVAKGLTTIEEVLRVTKVESA